MAGIEYVQYAGRAVALHTEGVDRNKKALREVNQGLVALHTEGVDRNIGGHLILDVVISRPPHGGRG